MKKFIVIVLLLFIPNQASAASKAPILLYHWIDEYKGYGQKELYVTPENFEKQMEFLKKNGYTLLTFERFEEIDKVNKPIFITFDDGWKDNFNALSVFKRLKDETFAPSGTIFAISDFIGRTERLSASELKSLAHSGYFSIQSHTATHPNLTKTTNLDYELKHSKEKIEQITGKPVMALAYPYGSYNPIVVSGTKKYYQYGLTTIPGPFTKKQVNDELFLLPRIYVNYSTSLKEFAQLVK